MGSGRTSGMGRRLIVRVRSGGSGQNPIGHPRDDLSGIMLGQAKASTGSLILFNTCLPDPEKIPSQIWPYTLDKPVGVAYLTFP